MKVSSPDDLLRLIQDLFGRLILFRATLCHVKETQVQRNNTHVDRWKDDFAVLLNLQHDELQGAMKEKLDKAMDCMVKGKKFCLQLSFDHKLLEWYSERVDGKRSDMEYIYGVSRYHYAKNISLIVHNCSTQVDCCLSWWTICLCFPFWALLGGPCYCLYRKALVTEMEEKVDVSIKFRMTDTPLPKCTKGGRCGLQLIQHMQTTGMSTRGLVDKFKCMDLVTYH
ncbi:hypothetical protein FSP39_024906 [Pinctada imbricata]|uniref:Uncharacterized protein n=1 Tax=Pinctada imbricata TaxID=66713 RepID=A0AA89BL62_PINIB|nr:hypothetical protein FSP39_024906 [Pinctada imbricata]